jgi:2-polyprenyl-3-methyl-5-hydroxy-6-metoxy-1,4-benzoquinol methylase
MKIAGGRSEDGIVIGNTYNKYASKNLVVRRIMSGFNRALSELVCVAEPQTIHEVGCGEGFWVLHWLAQGYSVKGTDFSRKVIAIARENATKAGVSADVFHTKSVYDVRPSEDRADLLVCSEVLEHLEQPERAIAALSAVGAGRVILTVPREPLWRMLNVARGRYVPRWGNTPGHLQHWSKRRFLEFVGAYFEVEQVRDPLPWTLVLGRPRSWT